MANLLIAVVCVLINVAASCDSGKIYFGSINDNHLEHVDKNGIYIKLNQIHEGYPLYKHESREYYIYHVNGTRLRTSFWVVGSVPGSLSVSISVQTFAQTPDSAREAWMIWNDVAWRPQRSLRAVCVDAEFTTCSTGRVRLHNLSPWNHHQRNITGVYHLMRQSHESRPVYRHISHGNVLYMYHVNGVWMVGPEIGRVSAGLFVLDYAWRPEYITESWIVFDGVQFVRDSRLNVTCLGIGHVEPFIVNPSEGEEGNSTDTGYVEEGSLTGELPICDNSYCQNGGICILNEEGRRMCACVADYAGPTCERASRCDDPPNVVNGQLISQTGVRHHDVAFYACDIGFELVGDSAAICGVDGQWTDPPRCMHWLDYLSPGIPDTISPPGDRRHFRGLSRRSHIRRRNKRSLLPSILSKLKISN